MRNNILLARRDDVLFDGIESIFKNFNFFFKFEFEKIKLEKKLKKIGY